VLVFQIVFRVVISFSQNDIIALSPNEGEDVYILRKRIKRDDNVKQQQ